MNSKNSTSIEQINQAIVLPLTINEEEKNFIGGVYNKEGTLITTCNYTNPNYTFVGPTTQKIDAELSLLGKSFFCGYFTKDYGSFLLETLSRLCSLNSIASYDQFLFVNTLSDLQEEDYQYEPLELLQKALNIPEEKILIIEDVARIEQLYIPAKESFSSEQTSLLLSQLVSKIVKYCCSLHKNSSTYLGQKILIDETTLESTTAVCTNKKQVQAGFLKRGYQVVNFDTLPFSQQVAITSQASSIAGFFGKHLFTSLFAKKETKLVCVDIPAAYSHKNRILLNFIDFAGIDAFFIREHEEVLFVEGNNFRYDLDYLEGQLEMTEQPNTFTLINKNFTGGNYLEVLETLHKDQVKEYEYMEIGTNKGKSLKLASGNCIAIDPSFILSDEFIGEKQELLLFQTTSDDFFINTANRILADKHLDLVFIDGSHQAEHALKDFFNSETFCKPNTIIVMHDVLPRSVHSSKKYRPPQGKAWTGDVWKAAYTLLSNRPDLQMCFLDAKPSGLLVITNLNPSFQNQNELLCKELIERTRVMNDDKLISYFDQLKVVDTDVFIDNVHLKQLTFEQLPTRKLVYHPQFEQMGALRE